MKCTKCESDIIEGGKFCAKCGEKVVVNKICFCTKCGQKLTPEQKFCGQCGNKTDENIDFQTKSVVSDTNQLNTQSVKTNSSMLAKFTYNKTSLIGQIVAVIILLMNVVFYFSLLIGIDSRGRIWISDSRYIVFNNEYKWIFPFFATYFLIMAVICFIKCPVIYRICLCIYSNKIIGVGGKNFYFMTESFELNYSNILNIKKKGNKIIIEVESKTYKCVVNDAQKAYDMIMKYYTA
ncbi:MAG: zinc ribbon domain-containing protein [Lachnospiraceae bacterium]|nr:zinc ribbon domain-containing protein [Lachnospiraceae bacterium]